MAIIVVVFWRIVGAICLCGGMMPDGSTTVHPGDDNEVAGF